MKNLSKFSIENLKRIQKALKIILDELELHEINRLTGNKIPIEKFEKEGLNRDDVLAVFDRINEKKNLIRLVDLEFADFEFCPGKTELEKMEFSLQRQAEAERYIRFNVINLEELKKIKEGVDKKLKKEDYIQPVKIFTNEVIPDRTAEIEKQMDEARKWGVERWEREKLHREQMKQDRILRTPVDKYTHALDLIIERAEFAEDGNGFSIEFYDFNFEQMIGSRMLEKFLTELQNNGCFEKYTRTNYAGGTRFGFINPSIKKLKEFKEKRREQKIKVGSFEEEVEKTKELLDKTEGNIEEMTKKQEQFEVKVKDRQIWINDYFLSKPFAVGSNLEFFEYIRSQSPNTLITRNKMPNIGDGIGYGYTKESIKKKGFIKILNELGFKDEILKAFFYKRSKNTLIYRGDKITKEDLNKAGVKFSLFVKELELAHARNSPE